VFLNELLWSLGITLQSVILGHIRYSAGDPVGANSIAGTVQQLSTIVIFGLANAAAVSIGTALGEGKREETKARADTLVVISMAVGAIACALIFLLRDPFISLYDIPAETKALARELLAVMAVITFFVSLSAFSIVGILRGGGDTFFCMGLEMGTLWGVALPAAFLAAMVFEIPVPLVLLCMKIDEPTKAVACWIRLRGNKWMRGLTRDRSEITSQG
jgi:Na+-driven multidrug efflux pump